MSRLLPYIGGTGIPARQIQVDVKTLKKGFWTGFL